MLESEACASKCLFLILVVLKQSLAIMGLSPLACLSSVSVVQCLPIKWKWLLNIHNWHVIVLKQEVSQQHRNLHMKGNDSVFASAL